MKAGGVLENYAESISLQYGDAEISFYNIKVASAYSGKKLWHRHRYYELHLAESECFTYRFHDRQITLAPGEMMIIPPDVEHFSVDIRDGHTPTVVSMSLSAVDGDQKFYAAFKSALNDHAVRPMSFAVNGIEAFDYTELYRSVLGVLKLKQVAAEFVNRLFSALLSNNNPAIASGKASAVLIDSLVNRDGTTLDEIAAATNYSKRHVTRLIRKTYGMSLSEMRRARLEGNLDEH